MLHRMAAPRQALPGHPGAWMRLVARCCRTSLAPPPLPSALLGHRAATPTLVASGSFDPLLPPAALGPAVQHRLGVGGWAMIAAFVTDLVYRP
ncbi:hypothetical protein A3Q37_02995 [Streptomyces sp. PTY087I2]|nr:hypothetical protein A3Q37_02995 [Streptomyces sp. PTY087I2]